MGAMAWGVVLVAVGGGVLLVWGAVLYNRLATLRNRCRNAFAQIDVQLKRRHDLIPNLVAAAQGYMAHERGTLEEVTAARGRAVAAAPAPGGVPDVTALAGLFGAESALRRVLGRFLAAVEAYPELKASRTMAQLMEDLTATENRIAFARQAYNDAVMFYNTAIQSVPEVLLAGLFGFAPASLFLIDDEAERAPVTVGFEQNVRGREAGGT